MCPQITTQSGEIITTESGSILLSDAATSNIDIQLFDFSVNLLNSLVWQYQNATNLLNIITQKQAWLTTNQTQFWQDWITNVFDLRTANVFGLAVWSIILNYPLFINLNSNPNNRNFGFGSNRYNFSNGNFALPQGGSIVLPLATNRLILQLRYFQLCSSGTVPEINRFMNYVFGLYNNSAAGQVYLVDNLNMTQTYNFLFTPGSDLVFVLNNLDVFPRPAGVSSSYVVV